MVSTIITREPVKKFALRWIIMVLAMVVASLLTNIVFANGITLKLDSVPSALGLFVGVGILALVNATIGSLLKLLFIPLNCMTLGLASLVINALLFWWVGSLGWGFHVNGFLPSLVGSILYSAANGVLGVFLPDDEAKKKER